MLVSRMELPILSICQGTGQGSGKGIKLRRRAATDPDAAVLRRHKRHPHKDSARHQPVKDRFSKRAVLAAINGHEIGR